MEPEPGNAQEIEGVLNPAAARGPDGDLYLFPRLVARGNYSRIGIRRASSGSGSRWSQRLTMSGGPAEEGAAKILALPSWNRCTAT